MELSSSRPSANQCLAFFGSVDFSMDALRLVDIAESAANGFFLMESGGVVFLGFFCMFFVEVLLLGDVVFPCCFCFSAE